MIAPRLPYSLHRLLSLAWPLAWPHVFLRSVLCVFAASCLLSAASYGQNAARDSLATSSSVATPQRISSPHSMSRDLRAGEIYMGVRLLGALKLDAIAIDGHLLGGLSALGWDNDEQLLYAVSDRGYVFHLRVEFDEDGLLHAVQALSAHVLRDARGRALQGRLADSEGLVVRDGNNGKPGDAQLVISFERRPRVIRFDPFGTMLGSEALPAELRDINNYSHSNRALESIAWHPKWHYLTAPEQPMRGASEAIVPLYALDPARHWRYPLAAEPNAGLTAIEVLDDGSILTLERGFGVFFIPVISTLRRIATLPEQTGALLAPQTIARFSSGEEWYLDNFEGLTHLGDGRILIVSDDNSSAFQSTLLAAFALLPAHGPPMAKPLPTNGKPMLPNN